jgi:hypothetical protein
VIDKEKTLKFLNGFRVSLTGKEDARKNATKDPKDLYPGKKKPFP